MSYWNGAEWGAEQPAPNRASRRRRLLGATLEAALIVLLCFGLIASTTFAAKGGVAGKGGAAGTFSLVLLDSTDGIAHKNQRITFDVSTEAESPLVGVRCYQGGAWIFDAYVGYFDSYLFDPWFLLDSGYWVEGASASCDARLFSYDKRGREKVMATLTFPVAP